MKTAVMKYELDQVVHYMRDNKPHNAPILARLLIKPVVLVYGADARGRSRAEPGLDAVSVYYETCHGLVGEEEAFASRADMLAVMENIEGV